MTRELPGTEPAPWPAWAVLLLLVVGGVLLAVAMVIGGTLKCERLVNTETPCPSVAGTAWT